MTALWFPVKATLNTKPAVVLAGSHPAVVFTLLDGPGLTSLGLGFKAQGLGFEGGSLLDTW